MSIKNAIKMINIQKSYSVHIVLFSPICSILSSLFHIGSLRSTLVLFGLHWSYSNHLFSPFNPLWSTSDLFGPYGLLWSYSAHSIDFGSIRSTLVLFSPSCPLWSYLVHFSPIWSNLVLFDPICSYSGHYVHFGPNLPIYSYSIHFDPIWLAKVLYSPHWSTLSYSSPLRSNSVHLVPIQSYFVHSVHFNPFVYLHIGKRHV